MSAIRVWAPFCKRVCVQTNQKKHAMVPAVDGWWTAKIPRLAPGSDYGFILDGEGPFPDPRSGWQPQGVHGWSRWIDPAAFAWTDQGWQAPPLGAGVIYELHVGTFTREGTFQAAITKLDHLVKTGVTHLELMPVNEFPGVRGWGYDGVDLFAPHHAYGGPQGLQQFVDACHARRLGVLLDVVYNHLGPSGNYLGRYGPYFTSRYSTPWGPALNFDGPESDEVRRFFCDNALLWLRDYHIDGLRLDAVHAIIDGTAQPFLEQLAMEVEQLEAQVGRPLVLIAESDLNDPRLLKPQDQGGYGLAAQWNDDFHHALHTVLTGEGFGYYADFGTLAELAKALQDAFVYDGRYSRYRRRRHGRPATGLSGQRFVCCLQNHDQIGNRARGDRTSQLLSPGRLKIGAALLFTSPFVPMLFQGEEWAASTPFYYFTDHTDKEIAAAVRAGRRREFRAFGWRPEEIPDPQALETFTCSKLNWRERANAPHANVLDWHQRLIRMRRSEPSLTDGRLENVHVSFDEQARWLIMDRGAISVVCNLAARPQRFPLRSPKPRIVLASEPGVAVTGRKARLPAEAVVILKY